MKHPEEGMIQVPGGKVWYGLYGAEAKGLPLVVLHGGPGAPHDYLEGLAALCDERPVVFYDQLGCGKSDRPIDPSLWNLDRFTAEFLAVIDALGLKKANLLGQSWGGMLAVSCFLRAGSERIGRLVLSAPLLSSPVWMADQRILLARMPAKIQKTVRKAEALGDFSGDTYQQAMTAYYEKHLCRKIPWPDALDRTFAGLGADVYLSMWGPSEFTCTGSLKDHDLSPALPLIDIPTLFTCGEFDEARPPTVAGFCTKVPDARLVVFEGASHQHHLEAEEGYLSVVRAFLKESSSQPRP